MRSALSEQYWASITSVYRRFLEFRKHWDVPSTPWAIILFVTKLMTLNDLKVQSALQYCVNIRAAEARYGQGPVQSRALRDFERSLRRQGALRPQKQAIPATPIQLRRAMRKTSSVKVRTVLELAWYGAARCSDVIRLKCKDVTVMPGHIAVNWSNTKSDPFRLGITTGVAVSERARLYIGRTLLEAGPDDLLFEGVKYPHVNRAMGKASKGLTAHSIRRGALHTLMRRGAALEELRAVSRHSSTTALMRYLPQAEVHTVRATAKTSSLLR
eukprot:TRINITY_DN3519_c0_g1_i1.p1 TRINITY_DN3519_c0_g1~~TRINITY_DN3519_c0_g1_i1.p1  ORF type:complete len:271 (-),score=41.07 TRINITY_DN3519_c0_g1_i1:1665-2477(-)